MDVSEEFSSKSMDDEERIKEWRKKNAEKVKAWRRKKRMEVLKKLNEPIILPEMDEEVEGFFKCTVISEEQNFEDENPDFESMQSPIMGELKAGELEGRKIEGLKG